MKDRKAIKRMQDEFPEFTADAEMVLASIKRCPCCAALFAKLIQERKEGK